MSPSFIKVNERGVRCPSYLIVIIIRHAEGIHLYPNLCPRACIKCETATSRQLQIIVCVSVCVYLVGDLEMLRAEDTEALRELQQLP